MNTGWMKAAQLEQVLFYARRLWRYKWLSVGLAWLICTIGWPIVGLIPPKYESSARVYVNADQLLTPLLRGIAVDDDPLRQVEFLQRTLLSRPNLEQVVHLSDLDLSGSSAGDREELLRRLAKEVSITPQTANLMTITYRNQDPTVAKNVVQALLTVFAENSTGTNRREMENAKRFLDQQIQTYESQLRAAEKRLAEFRLKYIDLLPGADGAMSRLEAGRNNVIKLKLDVADAHAKRDALQQELEAVPKVLTMDAAAPAVVVAGKPTGPEARLEDARARLADLRLRFTDQHPDVIAMRRMIAELEGRPGTDAANSGEHAGGRKVQIGNPVYDQVKVKVVEAETTLASAERRLKQAEAEQSVLEDTARAMPGVQAQAQDLDRDYAVKKKAFDDLLGRREQTRIGEAADTTADKIQFRIVDPPQVPIIPAFPNQPILLSGVLVGAIAGAIGIPLLLMQFDRSFTTVATLRTLGVPVLGSVSWLVFPDGRRRARIQVAAVCASASVLFAVYGVLLMFSINLYRLSLI